MTEQEWLACTDTDAMLDFLRAGKKWSPRKARLFAVAACRRIRHLYTDEKNWEAIEQAEADAEAVVAHDGAERDWVRRCRRIAVASAVSPDPHLPLSAEEEVIWSATFDAEGTAQAPYLRDIFGNPFRRVVAELSWLTRRDGIMVKLAQSIYEDRAFDRLPVLADSLEEAGCTESDILNHCRQSGNHTRGCWVVDLLLGKE